MSAGAPIHIRPLASADASAYKRLRDEALRCAPEAFAADYASARQRPAQDYARRFGRPLSGNFFLGAFNAQAQLVGCVGCERALPAQQRHSAQLVGLCVASSAQRQGLGRSLLLHCLAVARRVPGLEQIGLTVTARNQHVVRLYEGLGFTAWGLQPRALVVAGQGYDALHMTLFLHPHALPSPAPAPSAHAPSP